MRRRPAPPMAAAARHGVLVASCLMVLVPIAYVFIASVKTIPDIFGNPYGLPEQWTWSNYADAWREARIATTLTNSIVVTGISVLASTFLAAMIAYVLIRLAIRANRVRQPVLRFTELLACCLFERRHIAAIERPPPINPARTHPAIPPSQLGFAYA